jgi:hypothetical protein
MFLLSVSDKALSYIINSLIVPTNPALLVVSIPINVVPVPGTVPEVPPEFEFQLI